MKQLVVISGKGGTGKTSMVASFAALADSVVMADCDVDASNLHLILQPSIVYREAFYGGKKAQVDADSCAGCGVCVESCRFGAIAEEERSQGPTAGAYRVDPVACEGCGVCAWFCDQNAIDLIPAVSGEWFLSETRHGPMAHARLGVAAESSGKLVSLVRDQARIAARTRNLDLVLIDGAPGVGCPVIASITGADLALVVSEPTLSGFHDLERILRLTGHFRVPALVAVNKYDLNQEQTERAERLAMDLGAEVAGRVRFDPSVTEAQIHGLAVVEHGSTRAAADIRQVWEAVQRALEIQKTTSRRLEANVRAEL